MAKRTKNGKEPITGPQKGDFIGPPLESGTSVSHGQDAHATLEEDAQGTLPQQEEFWRPPVRFGSVPVEREPLGWDRRRGFRKLYPAVYLPFQVVERVSFGHLELEPNRLFWGDNLHIMRQMPPESIDLVYIDPPFFSGRQYNVIFGDQNELRSFSDIWEGGMPGYLIWLNARLYEMKRLLKKTGSIYVHCDWHASHYIKIEMDKIFGYENLRNEIVWSYTGRLMYSKQRFNSKHDVILFYGKTESHRINEITEPIKREDYLRMKKQEIHVDNNGREWIWGHAGKGKSHYYRIYIDEVTKKGRNIGSIWSIPIINTSSKERIGYPTQKPEALLERIIQASSNEGGVVADFFCGGGTTPAVAQRLGRRWIACDQSRVAVAITADRLTRQVEEKTGKLFSVPDLTVEHWGVYEVRRLAEAPPDQFRAFVLKCFGAIPASNMAVPAMKNQTQDSQAAVKIRQGAYLPHWTMEGATYAVTFRLSDSLPQEVLETWLFEKEDIVKTAKQMGRPLSEAEEKRLRYLHSEKVEKYLDAGHGACWLKQERIANIVASALKYFDGQRYDLLAWCVMPNHVHVVVRSRAGHNLSDILHSWKSFTAKEANRILQRAGQFWQEESYDHIIRDEADLAHCVEYVLGNPEKTGLKDWKWVWAHSKDDGRDKHTGSIHGQDGCAGSFHGQDAHVTLIHGYKGAIPVWVGEPDQKKAVTAADVQAFANAIRKTLRYQQDNLRDGIMLAWAFRPDALEAAERLRRLEQTDLNFIRLDMIRIDSPRFREHVSALSTDHADYENFLTFVQPPKVEVGYKLIGARTYKFDVSETVVMNPGAKIINVQWDFDYRKRFSSTPGYSFVRGSKKEVAFQAQYEFPADGKKHIACKVQDDMGGEGLWTAEIEVE